MLYAGMLLLMLISLSLSLSLLRQSTLFSSLSRFFRRGSPSSPAGGPQTKAGTPGPKGPAEGQEPLVQLVQAFLRHIQR